MREFIPSLAVTPKSASPVEEGVFFPNEDKVGTIDIDGNRLKPKRLHDTKGKCIVCGEESVGRGGIKRTFCHTHLSRYYRGHIDKMGHVLKKTRLVKSGRRCKVCGKKHYGKGFCLTHYNRFKIGQIDIDGNVLRELDEYVKKHTSPKWAKRVSFGNQNLTIREWADKIGLTTNALRKRIKNLGIEKALTTPIARKES